MLIERDGYEVLEATGGDEGLKLFLSHSVDAVVLDYQMPGMNGDVVAAKMKRVESHVPIMLLSAYEPLPKPPGRRQALESKLPVCHRALAFFGLS